MPSRASCLVLAGACLIAGCATRKPDASEVQAAPVARPSLEQRQLQTGAAYRQLQQARYDKKLAEQEFLNARAAYDVAQKNAEALKRAADAASAAYADAQARERAAEAAYERGIRAVDEIYRGEASRTTR